MINYINNDLNRIYIVYFILIYITFPLVSNEPNPQNVPPPVAVPPTLSNTSSDCTYNYYIT